MSMQPIWRGFDWARIQRSCGLMLFTCGVAMGVFYSVLPGSAEAAVLRSGEIVSIAEDATVPGDFYAMGGDVHISGVVEGDVYVLGGTVTINGSVTGDVVVVGGTVSIHGPVGDDVRVLGGKVVVAEAVEGDVAVAGGSLTILSTAHVGGDVLFYGGQAEVGGSVGGGVHAKAESLVINANVGSVDVILSGQLLIASSAHVLQGVTYQSPENMSRAQDAVIEGEVTRNSLAEVQDTGVKGFLPFWFMSLFASLVMVLLCKEYVLTIFTRHTSVVGLSGFLGLGVFLIAPIAIGVLIVSVLGALVGAFMLLVYIGLCLMALVLSNIFVGVLVSKVVVHEYRLTWLWALVGVVVTQALMLVPIIGPVLIGVLFLVVLGMLVRHIYFQIRS